LGTGTFSALNVPVPFFYVDGCLPPLDQLYQSGVDVLELGMQAHVRFQNSNLNRFSPSGTGTFSW
jgi:hypothetical protein